MLNNQGLWVPGGLLIPQGRLTATSGVPVATGATAVVANGTTVFYTPYNGLAALLWNGSAFGAVGFGGELSQLLTDTTKSPAAAAANSVYDVFIWSDGSTSPATIRATRGPAWTSSTARGTGAGTTELQLIQGVYTNKNDIINGPRAGFGTYLGSFVTNGTATLNFGFGGAASGGVLANLSIWNNYNRRPMSPQVTDSGVSYTYTSATTRAARASNNNRINYVIGLSEDVITGIYAVSFVPSASVAAFGLGAIALDTTTVAPANGWFIEAETASAISRAFTAAYIDNAPIIGSHFLQAVEASDGSHASTFDSQQANSFNAVIWA